MILFIFVVCIKYLQIFLKVSTLGFVVVAVIVNIFYFSDVFTECWHCPLSFIYSTIQIKKNYKRSQNADFITEIRKLKVAVRVGANLINGCYCDNFLQTKGMQWVTGVPFVSSLPQKIWFSFKCFIAVAFFLFCENKSGYLQGKTDMDQSEKEPDISFPEEQWQLMYLKWRLWFHFHSTVFFFLKFQFFQPPPENRRHPRSPRPAFNTNTRGGR